MSEAGRHQLRCGTGGCGPLCRWVLLIGRCGYLGALRAGGVQVEIYLCRRQRPFPRIRSDAFSASMVTGE